MAEKKEECCGELCDLHMHVVEDGFHFCCMYESEDNNSLGRRAGWVPPAPCERKEYVAKTKAAAIKKFEEILNEKHCSK